MSEATVTISEVVGEGDVAHRLVRVGAWDFTVWDALGDGEPRVRDVDAGQRLGLGRARDVRKLIRRTWPGKKLNDIHQRATVVRRPGQVASRSVREFWLSEAQLLKLCARSETPIADAILDDMIRVYMLVRRGLVHAAPPPAAPVLDSDFAARCAVAFVDESLRCAAMHDDFRALAMRREEDRQRDEARTLRLVRFARDMRAALEEIAEQGDAVSGIVGGDFHGHVQEVVAGYEGAAMLQRESKGWEQLKIRAVRLAKRAAAFVEQEAIGEDAPGA